MSRDRKSVRRIVVTPSVKSSARHVSAKKSKKSHYFRNSTHCHRHIRLLPRAWQDRMKKDLTLGVVPFLNRALATPVGVKANCYAHFLTLPKHFYQDRYVKTQPGELCKLPQAKSPLPFERREDAKVSLIERVMCDNPDSVVYLPESERGYDPCVLTMKLPAGYILGCCIVGAQDYHFLRRESIDFLLEHKGLKNMWSKQDPAGVQKQLKNAKSRGFQYCWSHIAGWSGGMKFVDAEQRLIVNPVGRAHGQRVADKVAVSNIPKQSRANHNYDAGHGNRYHYDTFVGFFIVHARRTRTNPANIRPLKRRAVDQKLGELGFTRPRLGQPVRAAVSSSLTS